MRNISFATKIQGLFLVLAVVIAGTAYAFRPATTVPEIAQAGSVDYLLEIPGIPGESTDKGHKDWINLLSWSTGVEVEQTSGLPTGKRQHKPFVITKELDKATPKLMEAIATGETIPQMTFVLNKEGRQGSVKIMMEDVIVTSWSTSGDADDRPTEEVAFYYNKISYANVGRNGEVTTFAWDFENNTPWVR